MAMRLDESYSSPSPASAPSSSPSCSLLLSSSSSARCSRSCSYRFLGTIENLLWIPLRSSSWVISLVVPGSSDTPSRLLTIAGRYRSLPTRLDQLLILRSVSLNILTSTSSPYPSFPIDSPSVYLRSSLRSSSDLPRLSISA